LKNRVGFFIVLLSVSAFFLGGAASAENNTNSTESSNSSAAEPSEQILRLTGEIDLISSSQIVVKDDEGFGVLFEINDSIPILDKKGNKTSATWVSRGSKARITYVIAAGGIKKQIKSITILDE